MIKWVLFDVFSTLVRKDPAFSLSHFEKLIGVKLSKEQFTRGFEAAVCTRNFKDNREVAKEICDYFHLNCNETALNKMSVFRTKGLMKAKLFPGYNKLFSQLRKTKLKLGVLSNTTHSEIVPVEKLYSKYFDKLFYSSDIGLLKPFPQIYEYVNKKLQVKPEEILFIDDLQANLVIPKRMGWKTFYFRGKVSELIVFLKEEKLI